MQTTTTVALGSVLGTVINLIYVNSSANFELSRVIWLFVEKRELEIMSTDFQIITEFHCVNRSKLSMRYLVHGIHQLFQIFFFNLHAFFYVH